jgi:hypothetical protein
MIPKNSSPSYDLSIEREDLFKLLDDSTELEDSLLFSGGLTAVEGVLRKQF